MFMNPGQFNGMMEMSQMQQMQHMPPQMQQQMGGGGPGINMGMSQNMSPNVTSGAMNPGMTQNVSQAGPSSPGVATSGLSNLPGSAGLVSTPVGSPGSMSIQTPLGASRGRGRGGRGRGNPPASAFLAAAAARGRGRVLSATVPGPLNAVPHPAPSAATPPKPNSVSGPTPVVPVLPLVAAEPCKYLLTQGLRYGLIETVFHSAYVMNNST